MKKFSKKLADFIICILSLLFSLFFLFLLAFGSHEDFSERENRALQKFPEFSFNSLANGSFFSKLSDFSADQFPFRTLFCSVSSLSELSIMRNECGEVIIADDGYLIARPENESTDILSQNIDTISDFLKENQSIPSFLLIAPHAIDVEKNKLPALFYKNYGNEAYTLLKEKIPTEKLIDISESLKILSEQGVQVSYKTDHHWTTRGAYEAYHILCHALGEDAYPLKCFDVTRVTNKFFGTSFSKSGLPESLSSADTIDLFRHPDDKRVKVTYPTTKNTVCGFYDTSALDKKDKYQIFLGGNSDIIEIRDEEKKKPKMLLIKDSFANSLIPFLSLHYNIDVIDLRYYKLSLKNFITNNKYDKILLVYGIDTLLNDISTTNITK